jgi:arylsulfatase
VQGDRLVFDYNFFGRHHVVESGSELPAGSCLVAVRFRRTGRQADVELLVDGQVTGELHLDRIMSIMSSTGPSVGRDHGSAVSDRYRAPFAFTGRLHRVDIDADPEGRHRVDGDVAVAEHTAGMARQ